MSTRSQPNNATPKRLQLAPENVPRMPFSSPMGEEVLSPTSPNASRSPPQHQIQLSQNRGRQKDFPDEGWMRSSQAPNASKRKQFPGGRDSKPRWPGLNVVTSFTKPPAQNQKAAESGPRENAGLGLKKQKGGVVGTSRKASVETLGLGHQPSGNSLRTYGSKGRLGDLKRASSKWSNLSPSDRAVVIGISVSPEELAQQSPSPKAILSGDEGLSEQHALDRRSLAMPTIFITPAKEKAPWSDDEAEPTLLPRQRAASSVYSQATSHPGPRVLDSAIVPPIPPLPPDAANHDGRLPCDGTMKNKMPPRIVSTCTEIDDADDPDLHDEERSHTGRSQLRILTKTASLDTIATKHRSQGWWNHIVSPFFPKSPLTFKTSTPHQEPLPGISTPFKQVKSLQEARRSFPPPPDSDGRRSGHTSWTDSTLDAEYEKRLELDGFRDRSTMISDEPQDALVRDSSLLPTKFEGFGAAAEYYEACLYDMHSETPYLECQNHTCVPYNPGSRSLIELGTRNPQLIDRDAGPGEVPNSDRQVGLPLAAQQASTNRFSAAFHEVVAPKSSQRPQSEATVIEDLETTPDVQEAHSAPILRAPLPVSATQLPFPGNAEREYSKEIKEPPLSPAINTPPSGRPRTFSPAPSGKSSRPNPNSANSPPEQKGPPKKYVAVLPPEVHPQSAYEQPLSPEPLSPAQQRQGPKGAILLEEVKTDAPDSHHQSPDPTEHSQDTKPKSSEAEGRYLPFRPDNKSQTPRGQISQGASSNKMNSGIAYNDQSDVHHCSDPEQGRTTVADLYPPPKDYYRYQGPQDVRREETTVKDLYPPPREAAIIRKELEISEKDTLPPRQPKRRRKLIIPQCRNCFGGVKPKDKKQKNMIIAIAMGLTLLVILVLVLVMTLTLTKKGHKMPVQSGWLNLTNFPPIPTGVSTIIQPNAVDENPDCIQSETMWSCALPKEEQQGVLPNAPNQPNFRVEIMFQNGTNATANTTIGNSSHINRRSYGHVANAVSARRFVRDRLLYLRDSFTSDQYNPSPAPPSSEDQTFLGNTTDRNALPFDGEFTPFFMSFESATKLSSRLLKRQSSNSENTTVPFPDPTEAIPSPDTNLDGTAAAANLYPFPSAQPLRLYDRGLDTEHYGFYTYFDRSIFLKSAAPIGDSSSSNSTSVPDDEDGGADENAALVRCTWAQTRFLVQIWTKKGNSAALLQNTNTTAKASHHSSANSTSITSSSANDFDQPGSFPYPITITLDRHGGDIKKKMVYCYGLDEREHYNTAEKQFQLEDRGAGGQLINPALGPFGDVNVTRAQGGPGGIDGGSGGCACRWQNFNTGL